MSLGVSPSAVAAVFLIFTLWDAMADPIMGWVTDNTRTRWGRRRPWIVVGATLCGITFPILWMFPDSVAETSVSLNLLVTNLEVNGAILWFLGFGILFFTSFTMWAMPYQSLLLEMSTDYNERTRITSYRATFQTIAQMAISSIWFLTQLDYFHTPDGQPDTIAGMRFVGVVVGIIMFVLGVLPAIFVRERYYEKNISVKQKRIGILHSFKETFSNRPFVLVLFIVTLLMLGSSIINGLTSYLSTYYVLDGDTTGASKYVMLTGVPTAILSVLCIQFFSWLSTKIGKLPCLYFGFGFLIVQNAANFFLFDPDFPELMYFTAIFYAPGFAAIWLMLPSMLADIVDHDELQTGERREGSYASAFSWIVKLSMSVALGLSGPMLDISGFDVALGTEQGENVFLNLRLLISFVPCFFLLTGTLLVKFYPLTHTRVDEIKVQLEERRGVV